MIVTDVSENLPPQYEACRQLDLAPPKGASYWDGRGLAFAHDGKDQRYIDFDPFAYLHRLSAQEPDRRLEVLEGGCGITAALHELKLGTRRGYPSVEYEGLGDKIRTTGVTLTPKYVDVAESSGVDELFIGPVDRCPFERTYDFIYDFYGAAYYSPQETLPVYGRILRPGCLAFLRLLVPPEVEDIRELATQSGLSIRQIGGPAVHDLLLTPQE